MLNVYDTLSSCRICAGALSDVAALGSYTLTSIFPAPGEVAPSVPMNLTRCDDCALVQLRETTAPGSMYREGYGYKSGVNEAMVGHLRSVVEYAEKNAPRGRVLDIGCNDGTLLKAWDRFHVERDGCDPIAEDVPGCNIVRDYFRPNGRKYAVVTSLSVLYDVQNPCQFAADIASILDKGGIWIAEVGYAGAILDGKWDGICHEHLAYYGVSQLRRIGQEVGLQIIDLWFNEVNGGSVCCVFGRGAQHPDVAGIVEREKSWDWRDLETDIRLSAKNIRNACARQKVYALGASTKGNMLLQTAWLGPDFIAAAIDRNPEKVGRTINGIPITSEEWARDNPPDAFLVLPYHFKEGLLEREAGLRARGVKFIFPLPSVEIL